MRVLLDTNILIHREANKVVNEDIGLLFRWLDQLKCEKCIHPVTVDEVSGYQTAGTAESFRRKMESYYVLKTVAPLADEVRTLSSVVDTTKNDINDTQLLNEVFCGRVDFLISEDKKIHKKAEQLGIGEQVLYIDSFIEKCLVENPTLVNYKVQTVQEQCFGNIDLTDPFFDSFRNDYVGFDRWFSRKADETAYVCYNQSSVCAFLYLKVEDTSENYSNITPIFTPKRRLKIGTLKVTLNGYKIGERFIKIVVDNALQFNVDQIYVTIFEKTVEQFRLIRLLHEYGFYRYGTKESESGCESVYVKEMCPAVDTSALKGTYPFLSRSAQPFLVPIYPEYHTDLLPDSILNDEDPEQFQGQESYRNAISKVYSCRSLERDIHPGDIIVFYRTGGYYRGVVTTLGIVENIITDIKSSEEFVRLCRRRSVFTDEELARQWDYYPYSRPFIVNFLYAYSFPHRINMKRLIELGVIADVNSAPRGFTKITQEQFSIVLKETHTNENIIVS